MGKWQLGEDDDSFLASFPDDIQAEVVDKYTGPLPGEDLQESFFAFAQDLNEKLGPALRSAKRARIANESIEEKLDRWVACKRARDFATADALRDERSRMGIEADQRRPPEGGPRADYGRKGGGKGKKNGKGK